MVLSAKSGGKSLGKAAFSVSGGKRGGGVFARFA